MSTIIIGDVHGCNGSLRSLLEKIKLVIGKDWLVFLGDLFDQGPDFYGVFLTVRMLQEQFDEDFILLKGNHEDYLLQSRMTWQQRMIWEKVGRRTTVNSFRQARRAMEDAIPWFLERVRLFWRTEQFQYVHAGIKIDPPEANDVYTLVHDHHIVPANRYVGRLTVTGHIALKRATWFTGDEETTEKIDDGQVRVLPETGVLCIDAGCGKGGCLTAMIIEGKEYKLVSEAER